MSDAARMMEANVALTARVKELEAQIEAMKIVPPPPAPPAGISPLTLAPRKPGDPTKPVSTIRGKGRR